MAARHLRRVGFRILARRVQTPRAEIDVLALEGRELVCVEVKTGRIGPRYRPGGRTSAGDLRRLWAAAGALGRRYGRVARVDLVEVHRGPPIAIVHHRELRRTGELRPAVFRPGSGR